jgi:mitogen-activated protein kinase kinase kinase 17/18
MDTGRAPWAGVVVDVLAAVRLVGTYTDAVLEVPWWLSAEAKDFLGRCLTRCSDDRSTTGQLLEHPFIVSIGTSDSWTPPRAGCCRQT